MSRLLIPVQHHCIQSSTDRNNVLQPLSSYYQANHPWVIWAPLWDPVTNFTKLHADYITCIFLIFWNSLPCGNLSKASCSSWRLCQLYFPHQYILLPLQLLKWISCTIIWQLMASSQFQVLQWCYNLFEWISFFHGSSSSQNSLTIYSHWIT